MDRNLYYRPTEKLADAIHAFASRRASWVEKTVQPWEAAHPNLSIWIDHLNHRVLGFKEESHKEEVPEGLSRAQTREYLKPVRGAKGDYWREQITLMNELPKFDKDVLEPYDIPSYQIDFDAGRMYKTTYVDFPEGGMVITSGPNAFDPMPTHLTPMPISEFYAQLEQFKVVHPDTPLPRHR